MARKKDDPNEDSERARLDQVAEAARRRFARYGYRRTSMVDIAQEAGLAKATLYLYFSGKDDIFRTMMARGAEILEARCSDAETCAGPFGARLAALLDAFHGTAFEWFGDGEHFEELHHIMKTVAGREYLDVEEVAARHLRGLFAKAEKAGEISLKRAGLAADEIARMAMLAATGAKSGPLPTPEEYRERLRKLARLIAAAVAPG